MDTMKAVQADGSFTEEMIRAAGEAVAGVELMVAHDNRIDADMLTILKYAAIYSAMLAAAPEPTP